MREEFYGHYNRARNDRDQQVALPPPKVLFPYLNKIRSSISQMGLFLCFVAAKRKEAFVVD
ncbi:hypothetical protein [Bradyrhizobium cytisi]|uniref:hypothetical protein n=1 Tax=Bradyrhizobium cytisi TaxID=515489 RepID=UPI001653176D|nr:hypothetical protein [Bradyrhizobium cytisi]